MLLVQVVYGWYRDNAGNTVEEKMLASSP